jgi:hypothetical protein
MTNTATPGNTSTATQTATVTYTQTNTVTYTATNTGTNTATVTNTQTQTQTNTVTATQTNTVTDTPIFTYTNTPTATSTSTATQTSTVTLSPTFTPTITPTPGTYAWPNPFNPGTSFDNVFKIGYLPAGSKVAFYTVSGELVINSSTGKNNLQYGAPIAQPWWEWNGRNTSSLFVSTGVYYYVAQDSGGKTLISGKLLVVNGK